MYLKNYHIFSLTAMLAVVALLFSACSDDDASGNGGYGKTVTVNAIIGSREGISSRASYVTTDVENEKIKSWWVAVVDNSGKIVKIIQREPQRTYAVEEESFEFSIAAGDYTCYSFANISIADVEELNGVGSGSIAEGKTMPADLASGKVVYDITSKIANGTLEGEVLIPMTGKTSVNFSGSGLQAQKLEVIRMTAKVELLFKNASTKDINVKYAKFYPLNVGNIPLMPDYTTLTYGSETNPIILSGVTATDSNNPTKISYTGISLAKNSYATESFSSRFYVRESLASSNIVGRFMVNVGIEREGKMEEILYTLSGDSLSGINRNDWVQIPIRFTDYNVSLNVNFYPPIGGYEAVIEEDNKKEFYCKFKTQGKFEIFPSVYNASDDATVYYPNWDYSSTTLKVSDPNNIFTVTGTPTIDTTTGEIIGTLGTNTGTAYVDVVVKVKTASGVWQDAVYKRRVYIIRA